MGPGSAKYSAILRMRDDRWTSYEGSDSATAHARRWRWWSGCSSLSGVVICGPRWQRSTAVSRLLLTFSLYSNTPGTNTFPVQIHKLHYIAAMFMLLHANAGTACCCIVRIARCTVRYMGWKDENAPTIVKTSTATETGTDNDEEQVYAVAVLLPLRWSVRICLEYIFCRGAFSRLIRLIVSSVSNINSSSPASHSVNRHSIGTVSVFNQTGKDSVCCY